MTERIDSYTRRTRTQKERIDQESIGRRSARLVDAAMRRLLYSLLKQVLKVKPTDQKIPVDQLTSLLIIPYGDAIGDLIVALPVARAIKRRNPECKIGIFVSERNRSLLQCEDSIDEQYIFGGRHDWKRFSELSRARKEKYQVVLNLHFNKLSDYGLICNYVGRHATKATLRMKRAHHYQLMFNRLSPFMRYKVHISQLSIAILDDIIDFGSSPLSLAEACLGVSLCPETFERVADRVNNLLHDVGASWFIYINPQGRNPEREWGFENIKQLTERIVKRYPDAAVIVTSSPAMQAETRRIVETSGNSRLLFIETGHDLNELASVCRMSRLIITPDTTAVHFASAENKPTIVFLPDTREIHLEWLPLYCPSVLFTPAGPDLPVRSISVDDVFGAATALLEGEATRTSTSFGERNALDMAHQRSAMDQPLRSVLSELSIE
jgi:ADP-heptose:LPS heptosyltransferase